MSTELIAIDACEHNTLNMTPTIFGGRTYWCEDCKKKIEIPDVTLTICGQEGLAGIIGLTFGEKWEQVARKGQV